MTVTLRHSNLKIEVFDDSAFIQKTGSPTTYNEVIQIEKDKPYMPSSQHAIKIYKDDYLINSAIILASGGGTAIHEDSALIDDNSLIIRCCNKLFSLTLPELKIKWVIEPDWATCFSIHRYQDSFITHGEASIARIDKNGNILWSYGGADIFVRLEDGNPFEMHDDYIELMDFNGSRYKIDYDGKTLDYQESHYYRQEPVTAYMKPQKPWWKFW